MAPYIFIISDIAIDNGEKALNTLNSLMKLKIVLVILCFPALAATAQTDLEKYFNLCLEFGAPLEVVELFQSFRTYKGENNGSVSYVVKEDNSLLRDKPYSEYQIWYTIDKELGLYQSTLLVRGDRPVLQNILTGYLRKFNELHGEPVYTNLDNGSLLIFWYNEGTFTVKARLILDTVNSYKYVSITHCSPQPRHTQLLRTLYNGTDEEEPETAPKSQPPPTPAVTPAAALQAEPPAEEDTVALEAEPAAAEEATGAVEAEPAAAEEPAAPEALPAEETESDEDAEAGDQESSNDAD